MSGTVPGLVSIIVPVYNREKMVGKTLDSILAQTYPHIEVLAVNDGSTDGSLSVLTGYAEKYPGKIIVIDQSNTGQVRARNRAIHGAQGEFIAFLDSDDTWEPDKLSLQMPLFRNRVGLVYSGINEVDPAGSVTRTVLPESGMRGDIYRQLLVRNRMTGGSVVVSRKAVDEVGLFDESFRAAENWDLWIRISRDFDVDYIDKPLVNYLKHPGNMSQDSSRMAEGTWSILQKHLPKLPTDAGLQASYLEAYAHYFYYRGVAAFGREEYGEARKMFMTSWRYLPFYQDSLLRIVRCFMGSRVNRMLSNARKSFSR